MPYEAFPISSLDRHLALSAGLVVDLDCVCRSRPQPITRPTKYWLGRRQVCRLCLQVGAPLWQNSSSRGLQVVNTEPAIKPGSLAQHKMVGDALKWLLHPAKGLHSPTPRLAPEEGETAPHEGRRLPEQSWGVNNWTRTGSGPGHIRGRATLDLGQKKVSFKPRNPNRPAEASLGPPRLP